MERIGLEGIMRSDAFQKGVQEYLSAIGKMNTANQQFATKTVPMFGKAVDSQAGKFAPLSRGAGQFGQAATAATGAVASMGMAAMTAAVAIGNVLANAIVGATTAFYNFVRSGMDGAARVQELDFVLQILAQRLGKTAEEMRNIVASVVDYGIRTDIAQNFVIELTRRNLDLEKSITLARIAQDAAIASASDSSETLQRLLHGVTTLQTEVIRTAGINISASEAYDHYAKSVGKTAEQLSITEKQQAFVNEIILRGAEVAGFYEAAMEAPGKQLRSFQRDMFELSRVASSFFLPTFGSVVGTMRKLASIWRKAMEEGGPLYNVMVNLGAITSFVADAFSNMAITGSEKLLEFIGTSQKTFGDFVDKAFEWGYNVVLEFATGIIRGASTVLVTAMQYIGNILTNWLAPGSPPKITPDLPKWGMAAMTEFLKGFKDADFDILKGIQQPLKSVMDLLVQTGQMTKGDMGSKFRDISMSIAKALSTGSYDPGIFDKIRSAAGVFGDEMVELTKTQLKYATAVKAVVDAQNALKKAHEEVRSSNEQVLKLTEEYNELLRGGADQATLDSKLAELNAAEEQRSTAIDSVKVAEDQLSAASEQLEMYREILSTQQQILDQLLDITRQQIEQPSGGGAGGGAGGGGNQGGEDTLEQVIQDLQDKFSEAIEAAKQRIRDQFAELWKQIQADFQAQIQPYIDQVGTAWEELSGTLSLTWNKISSDASSFWNDDVIPAWQQATTTLNSMWTDISTTAGTIWQQNFAPGWTTFKTWITAEWQGFKMWAAGWWLAHGEDLKTIINLAWTWIVTEHQRVMGAISNIVGFGMYVIRTIILGAYNFIKGWIELKLQEMREIYDNNMVLLQGIIGPGYDIIKTIIQTFLDNIGEAVSFFANLIEGDWQGMIENVKNYISNGVEMWSTIFKNGLEIALRWFVWFWTYLGIRTVYFIAMIKRNFDEFKTTVTAVFLALKEALLEKWNSTWTKLIAIAKEQPGKFLQVGKDIIDGIIKGITAKASALANAVRTAIRNALKGGKDEMDADSPSKLFKREIGESAMEGAEEGVIARTPVLASRFTDAIQNMYEASRMALSNAQNQYAPAGAGAGVTVNINISDVKISNGMDVAQFGSTIRDIVRKEVGGR